MVCATKSYTTDIEWRKRVMGVGVQQGEPIVSAASGQKERMVLAAAVKWVHGQLLLYKHI